MDNHDHTLISSVVIPAPLADVFDFFSHAKNLGRITPDFLKFRILQMSAEMEAGTQIAYRLTVHHFPVRWLTEITVWEPPHLFLDTQLKGPYKRWVHEHRFEALNGSTRMTDTVTYQLPFGVLGRLAHRLFVRRDVELIFQYRKIVIQKLFNQKS